MQGTDFGIQVGDLALGQRARRIAGFRAAVGQVQQHVDLGQTKAEFLGVLDEPHSADDLRPIVAIPAARARWIGQQATSLVVPQRLCVHPGLAGHLHCAHSRR